MRRTKSRPEILGTTSFSSRSLYNMVYSDLVYIIYDIIYI